MHDGLPITKTENRESLMRAWLHAHFAQAVALQAIPFDASFRRYYRLQHEGQSYVVMDAPPPQESIEPFVTIATTFLSHGVAVPVIHAMDEAQGFLLLSDLGAMHFQDGVNAKNADGWYRRALVTLETIHALRSEDFKGIMLPSFDRALCAHEWHLFWHWYLEVHAKIRMDDALHARLDVLFQVLFENIQAQPQVCVHRDYHCRNLLCMADDRVGVLDFQDAVWGPITYDAVSLLKDAYVDWPADQVAAWLRFFWEQTWAVHGGVDDATFQRWFDFTSVQRHCKVLGFFARQLHHFNRSSYMQDHERVMRYVLDVCDRYEILHDLARIVRLANSVD